jgi:hypothetical protein
MYCSVEHPRGLSIGAKFGVRYAYGHHMIEASCHCGSVNTDIPRRPRMVTDCNCSICRRYRVLLLEFIVSLGRVGCPLRSMSALRVRHALGASKDCGAWT